MQLSFLSRLKSQLEPSDRSTLDLWKDQLVKQQHSSDASDLPADQTPRPTEPIRKESTIVFPFML